MKNLALVLAVVALTTVAQATTYVTSLSDNFDITNSNDENVGLATRQSGTGAPNAWEDLGWSAIYSGYEDRIKIDNGQLTVAVCPGEAITSGPIWVVGQTDLVQASSYKVSWDQGTESWWGNTTWSFVQINSNMSAISGATCGFLVLQENTVQFWVDGAPALYTFNYTPTGPNGLHHFDVTVVDGHMSATVDGHAGWDYDFNTSTDPLNTKAGGIGVFKFFGSEQDTAHLDNFVYQIPEPATLAVLGLGGLLLRRRK
jgi:hypothetical protein